MRFTNEDFKKAHQAAIDGGVPTKRMRWFEVSRANYDRCSTFVASKLNGIELRYDPRVKDCEIRITYWQGDSFHRVIWQKQDENLQEDEVGETERPWDDAPRCQNCDSVVVHSDQEYCPGCKYVEYVPEDYDEETSKCPQCSSTNLAMGRVMDVLQPVHCLDCGLGHYVYHPPVPFVPMEYLDEDELIVTGRHEHFTEDEDIRIGGNNDYKPFFDANIKFKGIGRPTPEALKALKVLGIKFPTDKPRDTGLTGEHSKEHYTRLDPEPKDVMRAWELTSNLACALKYISRVGFKGSGLTHALVDLEKARTYLQFEIDYLKKTQGSEGGDD